MNGNTIFWKTFYKRLLFVFTLCVIMFFATIMRITHIATSEITAAGNERNGFRLKIANQRGTIFDCNKTPITNSEEKIIAAVSPTPRAITAISSVLEGEKLESIKSQLLSGKPALCEVPRIIECDGIVCTKVYGDFSEGTPAIHTVGYTDSDGFGVTGIEKAYDEILKSDSSITIYYESDAKGRILEGCQPEIENSKHSLKNGVITTIDINLQNIAEKSSEKLEKGAVVIADAENGKLRAIVSRPTFSKSHLKDYLNDENSPFLNRALSAYNVGSVFKPCVAAAGIENGYDDFNYTCNGSCKIVDRVFSCHKKSGHGKQNLCLALANSCNTFFYNFSFKIGGENIYKTAKKFEFGQSLTLCDGIKTAKGNLPDIETLNNIAYLANFSIGQGELLLSPVSVITLYSAIANGGLYYIPSLVEGTIKDGIYEEYDYGSPTRVMSKDTAAKICEYLRTVLTDGTGKEATPKTVSAAGKTATAQSGIFKEGNEICRSWFCGFFPFRNPKYVVVVFSEDNSLQTASCGEIFAEIADNITELENYKN